MRWILTHSCALFALRIVQGYRLQPAVVRPQLFVPTTVPVGLQQVRRYVDVCLFPERRRRATRHRRSDLLEKVCNAARVPPQQECTAGEPWRLIITPQVFSMTHATARLKCSFASCRLLVGIHAVSRWEWRRRSS